MDLGDEDPDVSLLVTPEDNSMVISETDNEGSYLQRLFSEHENIFLTNAASLRHKINELLIESMDILCVEIYNRLRKICIDP